MNKAIETINNPRKQLLKIVEDLSLEQLNKIPAGFNNNIIWNMGHLIAAQQGICYKRCGLELRIEEAFFMKYKPDTKPEGFVNQDEVDEIKTLLFSTLQQFDIDVNDQIFTAYPNFTTRYGVELSSIADAIHFLPMHEGLHIGAIIALKKLVIGH